MFHSSTFSKTGGASGDVRGFFTEFESPDGGAVPLGSVKLSNVLFGALEFIERGYTA